MSKNELIVFIAFIELTAINTKYPSNSSNATNARNPINSLLRQICDQIAHSFRDLSFGGNIGYDFSAQIDGLDPEHNCYGQVMLKRIKRLAGQYG